MFFSSVVFLILFATVVRSEEYGAKHSDSFCGDILSAGCGICDKWKAMGTCHLIYSKMFCMSTCDYCHSGLTKRNLIDVRYKGCYRDGFVKDFEKILPIKRELLDVGACTTRCHMKGYQFAALQNAQFCLCSNAYGRYGKADDESECLTKCATASGDQMCGGPWKNAVYEIAKREVRDESMNLGAVEGRLITAASLQDN